MTERMLWLLAPLLAVEVALKVVALLDLRRREPARGSRLVWALAIVFVTLFGWVAYFLVGRGEGEAG